MENILQKDKQSVSDAQRPAMVVALATTAILLLGMGFVWSMLGIINQADTEISFFDFVVAALLFLGVFYSQPTDLLVLPRIIHRLESDPYRLLIWQLSFLWLSTYRVGPKNWLR